MGCEISVENESKESKSNVRKTLHSSEYKFNREGGQGGAFDFPDPAGQLTLRGLKAGHASDQENLPVVVHQKLLAPGGSKTGYWVTKRVR
jgi:hypothetical protein